MTTPHPTPPTPQPRQKPQRALPDVRRVPMSAPLQWLALGWHDLRRCALLSLAHGVALSAFGALLLWLAHDRFWLLAGAFSGFLVMAPVMATSLYAMSRALERGEPASVALVWKTWFYWRNRQGQVDTRLVRFGLLLGLAGTGWVMTSAALITLWAPAPVRAPIDFLRVVVLSPQVGLFELWLALGGMMAAPVFASTVVALPLLLERQLSVLDAVLTSWRAVLANPLTLAVWAALLLAGTMLGLFTALLGLVVLAPLLGHASWHAYRALVDDGSAV